MLGRSAGESAALIGGILLVIEVLWFASIPLLGKEGFEAVKDRAFGWLKLPSGPISRTRHRIGIALLLGSFALDILLNLIIIGTDLLVKAADAPSTLIFGLTFAQQATVYIGVQVLTTLGVLAGAFVLDADFWGRLKQAFEWCPQDSLPGVRE